MSDAEWPSGWGAVEGHHERATLEAELGREIPKGHILFDKPASVLARCRSRDGFVFSLSDGRVAQVHLTWRGETDVRWPSTTVYDSLEAWQRDLVADAD
jgi:hypothetical protein